MFGIAYVAKLNNDAVGFQITIVHGRGYLVVVANRYYFSLACFKRCVEFHKPTATLEALRTHLYGCSGF